ncbi:BolA family protein [Ostreibacterium oceani]|uniref:BolA/IbaG family iron-sulfur metabolism protein n=1 Tax=Ostreibacterium oceani TaxID=2654998 RepID=A0A6N7EZ94_9GAMM|nr:BolA/IbaG family iron-sulfur metabolism protein [Ostreibacterium oceani]MPV86689.1 BolA/IbaG family iron-sulfur metabolism protein [Ostreibacterium oceani]
MKTQEIKSVIETSLSTDFVAVESADEVHFYVTVVSTVFEGVPMIKQHKMIKSLFSEAIENESIHAMSLKTYTPEKWRDLSS